MTIKHEPADIETESLTPTLEVDKRLLAENLVTLVTHENSRGEIEVRFINPSFEYHLIFRRNPQDEVEGEVGAVREVNNYGTHIPEIVAKARREGHHVSSRYFDPNKNEHPNTQ